MRQCLLCQKDCKNFDGGNYRVSTCQQCYITFVIIAPKDLFNIVDLDLSPVEGLKEIYLKNKNKEIMIYLYHCINYNIKYYSSETDYKDELQIAFNKYLKLKAFW